MRLLSHMLPPRLGRASWFGAILAVLAIVPSVNPSAALADQHRAARNIDAGDRRQDHPCIGLDPDNAADRSSDVGGRQDRGGDLVQKRLEEVVVAAIDDGHLGRGPAEMQRGLQSAEPGAYNDDALPG